MAYRPPHRKDTPMKHRLTQPQLNASAVSPRALACGNSSGMWHHTNATHAVAILTAGTGFTPYGKRPKEKLL